MTMRNYGNSNAKIIRPLTDKMDITPSTSPCTLHWSLLALRVALFCICHCFNPGGARLSAKDRDIKHSHHNFLHPFNLRMIGAATEDDPPAGVVQCWPFDLSPIWPPGADRRRKGIFMGLTVSGKIERACPMQLLAR